MARYQSGTITITIDDNRCTGCGECVMACPVDIFEIRERKSVVTDVSKCVECIACVNVCPVEAVRHSSC